MGAAAFKCAFIDWKRWCTLDASWVHDCISNLQRRLVAQFFASLKWLFRKRSVRVVGEFHHWHLSQLGHEANLSLHVARTSMRVLCDRNRASDRIEWLKKC